jgi:2-polyprenyl-6-methoxyphenol hydroxylase-like FAD-dependent oxidoreductase
MAKHAEIAGAGIAGLGLACQLAEAGWTVRVHERANEVRESGAGIALGQNGVDAMRTIGAFERAIEGGSQVNYWNITDQWGRVVQEESLTSELYSIPRSSLLRALLDRSISLGVEVATGSAVQGARQGFLILEGGRELPADLIVGADGTGSRVRESLISKGLKVRRIDLKVAGLRASMPAAESDPTNAMLEWLSGNRRVGLIPLDGKNRVAIYMFCPPQDISGRKAPIDIDSWSHSYPHLRQVFERVPLDSTWGEVWETHCDSWSFGNVGLIGDAAFSMAPNLGQGGCTALQAAITMTKALTRSSSVEEGLASWQAQERRHVEYVQRWSGRYSRLCSKTPAPLLRGRSTLFGAWGRSKRLNDRFAGVEARLVASP